MEMLTEKFSQNY